MAGSGRCIDERRVCRHIRDVQVSSVRESGVIPEPVHPPLARSAERLHALYVLNSLHVGGSESKTVRLVNAMQARGVNAGIAYLNDSDALRGQLDPRAPVWALHRRGKFSAAAVRALRQVIREHAPRAVLSVNMYPALYAALATAGLRERPRTIGLLNTTALPKGEEWRRTFYGPFLRRFDQLVFGCELQRAEWSARLRLKELHSKVIYNGIDLRRFVPADIDRAAMERRKLGLPERSFLIGTVGRLSPEKNQGVLIQALCALRRDGADARLLLVGDGPMRAKIEEAVRAASMQQFVTFAGSQSDVRPFLAAMDVFVLPSHVETFSNAALEAMATGKPVVLSGTGGAAEMVHSGVEGFILSQSSLQAELPRVLETLRQDTSLRLRMGRAGRERVERSFSLNGMVDEFCALTDAPIRQPGAY
jgi:glycosyltransferase involved in cell wall biosynthesis